MRDRRSRSSSILARSMPASTIPWGWSRPQARIPGCTLWT